MDRPKILFTTPVLEYPAAGGPQLRIETSLKTLARCADVHLVVRTSMSAAGGKDADSFYRNICCSVKYSPSSQWDSTNRYFRKVLQWIGRITQIPHKKDLQVIQSEIRNQGIDVVWFGYGQISCNLLRALRQANPHIGIVCDTDSVWSRFILREMPYIESKWRRKLISYRGKKKEREEQEFVRLSDIVTAVSEVDAEYYRSLYPRRADIRLFSNVIDLASYDRKPPPPNGFRRPCIYLAGTFGHVHSPMDTAARWVLNEVLPIVRLDFPDIHFYIVGRDSDRTMMDAVCKTVTVTGKLPSVLPFLCHADVALVPLKFESGTRFKILEAAACNVPIVSTTLGAEGLPVVHGRHILLADSPKQFAGAIVRVLRDPDYGRSLAANARMEVEANFSVEHLETEARAILKALARLGLLRHVTDSHSC